MYFNILFFGLIFNFILFNLYFTRNIPIEIQNLFCKGVLAKTPA